MVEFNKGSGAYSYSQMNSWEEKLADWSDNLSELDNDLGLKKLEPMGVVSSIEMYWN